MNFIKRTSIKVTQTQQRRTQQKDPQKDRSTLKIWTQCQAYLTLFSRNDHQASMPQLKINLNRTEVSICPIRAIIKQYLKGLRLQIKILFIK